MHEVCRLIRSEYYKSGEPKVQNFLNECDQSTSDISFSRTDAIKHINRKLSAIRTSHLSVFSPSENRWLWEHQGSDTGLRARMIEGEVIIIQVLPNSPAALMELKVGDVIVAINGESPDSVEAVQGSSGNFKYSRAGKFFETNLYLADLIDDMSPQLVPLANGVAVLKIPSFLPQYFEQDRWRELAMRLNTYRGLIVDLRENAGGSFPAMLRTLSPFMCEKKAIGSLWRTARKESVRELEMKDELSAESQLALLAQSDSLVLKTFEGYGCFEGNAIVLVDDGTSSVSEIFAHALLKQPRVKVWGTPTAGQVVMARWYSLGTLGGGDFAISIPIAGYRAVDGATIESEGVIPQKELQYDLSRALRGEDSWITNAVVSF
ncbi:MAG: PDZ domain-containing protein [Proteobacteria bacterium]|nr:MAG: PDZ domain-containing protein [Pseudomonadota bacterium]